MLASHLYARGIVDPRILDAFRDVPRERFVPRSELDLAYDDGPLPIAAGQTISQPYIVALMADALALEGSERLLEVGCGSGYAAAIYSKLVSRVDSIERQPELIPIARRNLAEAGIEGVHVHEGDGTLGLPQLAPFDAISIAAAAPDVPPALLDQLALGGRLVMPVGEIDGAQELVRLTRLADGSFSSRVLGPVRFVPLLRGEIV